MMQGNNSRPRMCNLSITLSCMLRCKICYHWQNDEKNIARPDMDEWKRFISSMQNEVSTDFMLVFGGGEPLLYQEDLIELISFSSKLGFKTALATSGHTIDKEYAGRLAQSGLNNIDLTIFSLNSEIHDYVRGIKGSLGRVLKAVDYLRPFNDTLKIGINNIIVKPCIESLLDVAEWVNKDQRLLGINYQAITRPFHTPFVEEWYKTETYRPLWPDDLYKLESTIDAIISLKEKGYRISNPISQFNMFKSYFKNPSGFIKTQTLKCNLADNRFFALNSDGSITLCPYMEPLGKITHGNFHNLWYSDRSEMIKEKIDRCSTNCHHLINCWYEEEYNEQEQRA